MGEVLALSVRHNNRVMTFDEYLVSWAQLHGTKPPSGVVKIWLRISFSLSTPLTRFNPNFITGFALILMATAIYLSLPPANNYFVASALVLVVGLVDSFDGIVAVRTSKASPWGAFLDGIVDRFVDVGIGILFIVLGAPTQLVIVAISIALIHEYMRAKAGGLNYRDVEVVTPAEKPTRIALGVMFLLACGIFPDRAAELASIATLTWIALGIFSFVILMRAYRKRLKN